MVLTEKQTSSNIQDRISEIRKMRLGDIADNSHNWRLHPEYQRKALGEIYKKVGWAGMPLVYFSEREGKLTFIDGHLRKEETPDLTVRVAVTDLNDAEADILLSTYDPLGRLAEVNVDALAELEKSIDIDLGDFWPVGELETLLKGLNGDDEVEEAEPQIDKAEELQKEYGTALGQVWRLGEHRLAVGDCTDEGVVEGVMEGEIVDACITDPPYGQRYLQGGDNRPPSQSYNRTQKKHVKIPIIGDDTKFDPSPFLNYDVVVLWGANNYADLLPCSRGWFVWDKKPDVGSNDFADGEMAWTNLDKVLRIFRHRWSGVLRASQNGQTVLHPTEKPISLFVWCIEMTNAGNTIFDPFLGSGTTMIACENLNRKCRGIEIDPGYAAVSINRWESHTGQKAELIEG